MKREFTKEDKANLAIIGLMMLVAITFNVVMYFK